MLFGESINAQNHIGSIDPHCDVVRVIEDAYANARFLCDQYYLASPELVLKHHNGRLLLSNRHLLASYPDLFTTIPNMHTHSDFAELYSLFIPGVFSYQLRQRN